MQCSSRPYVICRVMNNTLVFVLLMSIILVGIKATASKNDVEAIKAKINKLKRDMKNMNKILASLDSWNKKVESKIKVVDKYMDGRNKKAYDVVKIHQRSTDYMTKHGDSFTDSRKRSSDQVTNTILRQESSKGWETLRDFNKFRSTSSMPINDVRKRKNKRTTTLKDIAVLNVKVDEVKNKTSDGLDGVENDFYIVSRQAQQLQFNEFEKARSDGNSGIKQIRTHNGKIIRLYIFIFLSCERKIRVVPVTTSKSLRKVHLGGRGALKAHNHLFWPIFKVPLFMILK